MEEIKIDKEEVIERLGLEDVVKEIRRNQRGPALFDFSDLTIEKKEKTYDICTNSKILYQADTPERAHRLADFAVVQMWVSDITSECSHIFYKSRRKPTDFSVNMLKKMAKDLVQLREEAK